MKHKLLIILVFLFVYNVVNSQTFNTPLVFVSRNHQINGNILYPQAGLLPGMGPHSKFTAVGGRLLVRNADGSTTVLVDSTMSFNGISLIDVQQPCVNWDGNRILFAGIENRDSSWRIYEINKNGTGFRKITFTDRFINLSQFGAASFRFQKYDDIDPVYLPDGRIVFASTRFPSISQFGSALTTNLFIMDSTGTNMFRITTERNGAEKPTIDPISGRIVYSRWWLNADMPSNLTSSGLTRDTALALTKDVGNLWQVNIINPDADMLKLYAGDPQKRNTLFGYRPRIDSNGDMFACYVPHLPMVHTGGSTGIRYFSKGLSEFKNIVGVDTSTQLYTQNPPSTGTMLPPYAVDPLPLPDGRVLFSYAITVEAQDYGIYVCNKNGSNIQQVTDFFGTLELNAELLIPKTRPPLVDYLRDYDVNKLPPTSDPATFYQGGLFRFDCMNIYANAPVDAPIGNAPNITRSARFKFFLNHQRQNPDGLDEPILFRTINIDHDGKVAQGDIPANVQMFEQVTDSLGRVLSTGNNKFAHVTGFNFGSRGTGTKCVGCHAGHTQITVPVNITEAQFTNLSTSASTFSSSVFPSSASKNVIDRKARNKDLNVCWISNGGTNEYVELQWNLPLDLREIKLYNIFPNSANQTDIQVSNCEIYLYNDGQLVKFIPNTGGLDVNGKSVLVSPMVTVNKIKVVIKSFTGLINGLNKSGLAEVEVSARVSDYIAIGIANETTNPKDFKLYQNYPNPFNSSTVIKFNMQKRGYVSYKLYDVNGREVGTIQNKVFNEGLNSFVYSPESLATGMYFLKVISGSNSQMIKLLYLK
ncbi:MAG: T9SS type A sorting domain-containing protein [Ignavibacteria bacterium]